MIVGSTGRIGSLAMDHALRDGWEVIALVRDPSRVESNTDLTIVAGDVRDADAVGRAARGADAVISAVGPRTNTADDERAIELGMRNLVTAMADNGVRRLVALSGAGVDVPNNRRPLIDRLVSRLVRRFARHVVGAKQREYDVFAASTLAWTALRPPLVADGPPRGYDLDLRLTPGARVTRSDVARALLDQLTDDRFIRAAPFVLPDRRR